MDKTTQKQFNVQARKHGILTIKVPPHYKQLVDEEIKVLGRIKGPLYRAVYPTQDRMVVKIDHEVPDFVEDRTNMPRDLENVLVHKYYNRALFLVTDVCAGHCMYCFRQDVLSDLQARELPAINRKLEAVITYLKEHPEVTELIMSGGDPLSVPFQYLEQAIQRLKTETHIQDIRVHTRNVAFAPRVLSEQLCELLGKYHVRMYLHIIHPYEIVDSVIEGIQRLRNNGVKLYGQFPVLRGINDHYKVLEKLICHMDQLEVNPINIFIPDPINYSAPFRISMKRLLSLMDNLYWKTSSWTNAVRLVMDTPIGKVRREDMTAWDKKNGVITFHRDGKTITYHDFPENLDIPGDLETLLWRS
jgi:lysine 2,3-aminomutase